MSESTLDLSQLTELEKTLPVRTNNTIIPVTIKQILEAQPSVDQINSKIIDNVDRKEVSIVGMILHSARNSYSTMYEIDDGTGTYLIQVIHPENTMNDDNSPPEIESFNNGQYVHVVGRLSTTSQEDQNEPIPVISAYSVRLCKDSNQIACHFLQSLYVHLLTLKNNENKVDVESSQNKITDYLEYEDKKTTKVSKDFDNDSGNEKIDSSPISINDISIRMTSQKKIEIVKRSVLRLLNNTTSENGYEMKKIINNLSNIYSIDDIQSAVDSLTYNGEIICTGIDERYSIV